MIERDLTKLPKWAQDMISVLQKNCEYYKIQMEGMTGVVDTNTYFDLALGSLEERRVGLPDREIIYFYDGTHTLAVQSSEEGGVTVRPKWASRIRVYPQSSNVVRIEVVGKDERGGR